MSSIAITKFLEAGLAAARRAPSNARLFVTAVPPNPFDGTDTKIDTTGDSQKAATDSRGVATATKQIIEEATEEEHDATSQVINTAQNLTEKAKQTVQDAWGSAKDTAQKVKDTVVGKAEDVKDTMVGKAEDIKDYIKEKADESEATLKALENREAIKKAMNTKNYKP